MPLTLVQIEPIPLAFLKRPFYITLPLTPKLSKE